MEAGVKTFKQFLGESIIDLKLLVKLINNAAKNTPRLYLYCYYDGTDHEGFVEDARINDADSAYIDYKKWSEDENTFIPATMAIYEEDIGGFYFGQFFHAFSRRPRRALMYSESRKKIDEERKIYASKISNPPDWLPQHAEGHYKIGDITFSASKGLGSVPSNANVWYEGFVATMTPSTFLSLALDDEGHQEPTSKELEALVKEGYAVGIPFLDIEFDPDGNELPRIKGHEGRGRMRMIRRVLGDIPIPVHFFLRGGMRSKDLTSEITDEVKLGIYAQGSDRIIRRPIREIWVNGKKV